MTGNLHSSTREAPQDEGTRFPRANVRKIKVGCLCSGEERELVITAHHELTWSPFFPPLYLLLRLGGPSILVRSRLTNLQRGLPIRAAISAQLLCTPRPPASRPPAFKNFPGCAQSETHNCSRKKKKSLCANAERDNGLHADFCAHRPSLPPRGNAAVASGTVPEACESE